MTLPDRLIELMETRDFSQSRLARAVGVTQQTIGKLVRGETNNSVHIHKIAKQLGTTVEYLTGESDNRGEGAMPVPNARMVAEQLSAILIPEIDIAYSMGGGITIDDYHGKEMVPFPRDWLRQIIRGSFDQVFVARGSGDSMMPTLLDGDIIVVDTAQRQIDRQDALWAISYGDLGMVKRVRKQPDGGYQINSDNQSVSAITAYDDEMHVIGRVIWLGRRM